jgi:predicted glycogen debranching enzyme
MPASPSPSNAEWLEADGQGGFAFGAADTIRTRRYHALLLAAPDPAATRLVLVNGVEAWVELRGGSAALVSHRYQGGVIHPDGASHIVAFTIEPWPTWTYGLPDGSLLVCELFIAPGSGQTTLRWQRGGGEGGATLRVRPLLSGRDYHALHHENPAFRFDPVEQAPGCVVWQPYPDLPPIAAHGGFYAHDPIWLRQFLYAEEAARGLDFLEDLASPGILSWDLAAGPATLAFRADRAPAHPVAALAQAERARRAAIPKLHRAALMHLAACGERQTLIAGYPWFTDWGRDTFIALRGVLLATGRHDAARAVLLAWAGLVSEGMLPNRFPDGGGAAEFNAVDASLWFVVAVHDLLAAAPVPAHEAGRLRAACLAILAGYAAGTRYGIRMDADGLLACGQPDVQLTWMDAKVGDWVVTPRIGKPVEVQALWINALAIAAAWPEGAGWAEVEARARAAFLDRFPDPANGGLADVVDPDGVAGTADFRVRPNQILAAGGLPHACVPPELAQSVLALVEARLLTPLGLRTLDPADPDYSGRYEGGVRERDGAYHQGTVWPWLLGPFVEAWLRRRGDTPAARAEAAARFLPALHAHLHEAGLGSVSEIADGDAPHTPRGCPFQAWSIGELLRIEAMLTMTA